MIEKEWMFRGNVEKRVADLEQVLPNCCHSVTGPGAQELQENSSAHY